MLTSLQCGRQIAQLKDEYEETKKTLEEEASKLRQVSTDKSQQTRLLSLFTVWGMVVVLGAYYICSAL